MRPRITVFGGSDAAEGGSAWHVAGELGRMLALSGYDVVNGGYGGTMEAVGRAATEAGGHVIGVTVRYYGPARDYVTREEQTPDFWTRTRRMIEMADGFVVLPGRTGTLAEAACAWEMIAKRHARRKPLVFLGEFWRPLVELMQPGPDWAPRCGGVVCVAAAPSEAVRFLDEFHGRAALA
jgi:uncharacterized protein (TIGR00730 family)